MIAVFHIILRYDSENEGKGHISMRIKCVFQGGGAKLATLIAAAEALRIPLSTLNQKIKRLNIDVKRRTGA